MANWRQNLSQAGRNRVCQNHFLMDDGGKEEFEFLRCESKTMNPPPDQRAPHYVTCPCNHCSGNIEFDANELAEEYSFMPCPHCGLETKLFIPHTTTAPKPAT